MAPTDDPPKPVAPGWVWDHLPDDVHDDLFRRVAAWVEWLEASYDPWVQLPACWPLHEGLRTELAMYWMWHRLVTSSVQAPAEGVRWHHELRRSAEAWKALANCAHEPRVLQHAQLVAAKQQRRDGFLAEAIAHRAPDPHGRTR